MWYIGGKIPHLLSTISQWCLTSHDELSLARGRGKASEEVERGLCLGQVRCEEEGADSGEEEVGRVFEEVVTGVRRAVGLEVREDLSEAFKVVVRKAEIAGAPAGEDGMVSECG